jgi:hypothetical protein
MSVGRPSLDNLTTGFNSVYHIYRDLSGWDQCTIQVVGPLLGRINILGTNDSGAQPQNTQGNAQLAINYTPIQATDLSNGASVNAIYGPGLFKVSVNAQFLNLQGVPATSPTNVYRILLFNTKIN